MKHQEDYVIINYFNVRMIVSVSNRVLDSYSSSKVCACLDLCFKSFDVKNK
jgi:hypothetical protein